MRISLFGRSLALLVSIAMILALGATMSFAQKKMMVSGKMTQTYTKKETIDVGDVEGHAMTLDQENGTNVSTGANKFLDGGNLVNVGFSDLVKGNGPHQGYVTLTNGADGAVASWKGNVTTVMSKEGKPYITFKGTFSWIKGMGQYANIQGTGTYGGHFTSENSNEVEWQGEYSIGK
jgi:hypothetical protein